MLEPGAKREIEAAFVSAQAKTRAPLQCVLAETSADYALAPVLVAALIALLAPWPLLAFTTLSPERVFLVQLTLFAFALALIVWAPVRVALATTARRRSAGHRAALVQFVLRGLDRAPERNGVLLYVCLAERYARIVADMGLDGKISAADWRGLIDDLGAAMKKGEREAALRSAAMRMAELLVPHFPASPGDEAPHGQRFHVL